MDDSGSLSKRRRALILSHVFGWMAQDFLLFELVKGTMLITLIDLFLAVVGTNPVGQVTAGIVGVVGLALIMCGIRATWSAGRMWMIVAPLVVLGPISASLAIIHS